MEEYREIANLVKVSTDTGAVGFHGFVTQLYDRRTTTWCWCAAPPS